MALITLIGPTLHVARRARLLVWGDGTFLAPTHQARRVASVICVCVERLETFGTEVAAAEETGNTDDGVEVAGPRMVDEVNIHQGPVGMVVRRYSDKFVAQ